MVTPPVESPLFITYKHHHWINNIWNQCHDEQLYKLIAKMCIYYTLTTTTRPSVHFPSLYSLSATYKRPLSESKWTLSGLHLICLLDTTSRTQVSSGDSNNTRSLFISTTNIKPFISIAIWVGAFISWLLKPFDPPKDLTTLPSDLIRHTRCNWSAATPWDTMNCPVDNWIVCQGMATSRGRVSTCSSWPSVLNSFIIRTLLHDTSTPCVYVRERREGSSLTGHCITAASGSATLCTDLCEVSEI